MLIFIHGIAAMLSTNNIEFTKEEIETMLKDALNGFTTFYRRGTLL
ncbi:MAG TPA: hypothetical protein VIK72_04105 [Clostridiaceae bacterium]